MPTQKKQVKDPYVAAVDIVGDSWTFLVLREAFFGARRFQDFCNGLNITRTRLSARLKYLVAAGLFSKHQYHAAPARYEYQLTEPGRSVYPIALALIAWGQTWRPGSDAVQLTHKPCGHALRIKTVCRHCGEPIVPTELDWPPLVAKHKPDAKQASVRGWRKMSSFDDVSLRPDPAIEVLKAVGDRWSMLIMFGALQMDFRFRGAQATLGVAHNILSNRLGHLLEQGLLERVDDHRNSAYRATQAGRELLDVVLAMRTWAIDCLPVPNHGWSSLVHRPCGAQAQVVILCGECDTPVRPEDVTIGTDLVRAQTGQHR